MHETTRRGCGRGIQKPVIPSEDPVRIEGSPEPAANSDPWPRPKWWCGWQSAFGHSPVTVRHDARRASVSLRVVRVHHSPEDLGGPSTRPQGGLAQDDSNVGRVAGFSGTRTRLQDREPRSGDRYLAWGREPQEQEPKNLQSPGGATEKVCLTASLATPPSAPSARES